MHRDGFFAAASCMSFQQCRFNFGSEPFKYPPKSRSFDSFNSHAYLKDQDKIVLPRHLFLEQLRKLSVREDSCTLCFDLKGIVRLEPCTHRWISKQRVSITLDLAIIWTDYLELTKQSFVSSFQGFLYDVCVTAAVLSIVSCRNHVYSQRRERNTYIRWLFNVMIWIQNGASQNYRSHT